MSNEVMKYTNNSIMTSKSKTGAAGKGMIVMGASGILLPIIAAIVPVLGVFGVCIALIALGFFLAE